MAIQKHLGICLLIMCLDEKGDLIPFPKRTLNANFIGIPGILKAMKKAITTYGTIPMEQLIEPAIQLADQGIKVNWLWEKALEMYGE